MTSRNGSSISIVGDCRKGRVDRLARYRSDRTGLRLWEINI